MYYQKNVILDDDGNQITDDLGNPLPNENYGEILAGKDPDVPVITGIFQSFGDAPGGFKEELKEIIWQAGMEYVYAEQFAVRGGYFHEADTKGGRQFFTLGAGLKYNVFGLDFSYLIPIFGTILSYIFLKELITFKVLISLLAVSAGIYFVRKGDILK